jgi:hypothetical protein
LALRVGPRGLRLNLVAAYAGLRCLHGRRGPAVGLLFCGAEDVDASVFTFLSATNNQLRTGADKGNPTV